MCTVQSDLKSVIKTKPIGLNGLQKINRTERNKIKNRTGTKPVKTVWSSLDYFRRFRPL